MTTITENLFAASRELESYKALRVHKYENLLIVQFNRPQVKNAFNRRTYFEIIRVIQLADYDDSISIVVFTGVGEAFCSGNDLRDTLVDAKLIKETAAREGAQAAELKRLQLNRYMINLLGILARNLISSKKILIALVNGASVGIGFTLAALCDVIYCTENAFFSAPFVRLGIVPEMSSSYLIERIVGRSKATEFLVFGARLSAEEALRFNFAARIYRNEELLDTFWPEMIKCSKLPAKSMVITKRLIRNTSKARLMQALSDEITQMIQFRLSKIHMAAIEDFTNKRTNQNSANDNNNYNKSKL